ncbi:hypothetical protein BSL78_28314 [Apostichopus japonicus]|uniref:Uncharacterized protein n=1 Tax=Stichopus japonicus TaxID=307972 RepID=A0A2G8JBP5_STIJA|nr:hypothetical protein BSL78_30024 [Apostichopus japonicus]PIK34863.1 hypothetical protein BSL78_28314 [Apostichopus japonicus]
MAQTLLRNGYPYEMELIPVRRQLSHGRDPRRVRPLQATWSPEAPEDKRWRTYLLQLRGHGTTTGEISRGSPRRVRNGAKAEAEAVPTAVAAVGAGKDTGDLDAGRGLARRPRPRADILLGDTGPRNERGDNPQIRGRLSFPRLKTSWDNCYKSRVNRTRNNKGLRQFHHNRRHRQHRLRTISPLRRPRQIPGTTSPPELMSAVNRS